MSDQLPILYSFRRCPYAMRARLGIRYAGQQVLLREVVLRDKPEAMLAISPKGTVPVLQLPDGRVIEESREILEWALEQHDPDGWKQDVDVVELSEIEALIDETDGSFKEWLDLYKYANRHPEHPAMYYREKGKLFLQKLEDRLTAHSYLFGESMTYADAAVFPFVRQFAFVDKDWFYNSPYTNLIAWLDRMLASELFLSIMEKYDQWKEGDEQTLF